MFYVANIYWNINRNKNHFHYNIQHLFQDHLWSLASRYVTVGDGASDFAHRLVEFRVSKWSNFLMLLLFLLHSLHLLLGRIIEILCLAKIECSKIAKRFFFRFGIGIVFRWFQKSAGVFFSFLGGRAESRHVDKWNVFCYTLSNYILCHLKMFLTFRRFKWPKRWWWSLSGCGWLELGCLCLCLCQDYLVAITLHSKRSSYYLDVWPVAWLLAQVHFWCFCRSFLGTSCWCFFFFWG